MSSKNYLSDNSIPQFLELTKGSEQKVKKLNPYLYQYKTQQKQDNDQRQS